MSRMTAEQGADMATRIYQCGDLSHELTQRAAGYGQPFRAILEKAADIVKQAGVVRQ